MHNFPPFGIGGTREPDGVGVAVELINHSGLQVDDVLLGYADLIEEEAVDDAPVVGEVRFEDLLDEGVAQWVNELIGKGSRGVFVLFCAEVGSVVEEATLEFGHLWAVDVG